MSFLSRSRVTCQVGLSSPTCLTVMSQLSFPRCPVPEVLHWLSYLLSCPERFLYGWSKIGELLINERQKSFSRDQEVSVKSYLIEIDFCCNFTKNCKCFVIFHNFSQAFLAKSNTNSLRKSLRNTKMKIVSPLLLPIVSNKPPITDFQLPPSSHSWLSIAANKWKFARYRYFCY